MRRGGPGVGGEKGGGLEPSARADDGSIINIFFNLSMQLI